MPTKTLLFKLTLICLFFNLNAFSQTYNTYYGEVTDDVSASGILADLNTFEGFGIKKTGSNSVANSTTRANLLAAKNWILNRYETTLGYSTTDPNVEHYITTQDFTISGRVSSNIIATKKGTVYPNTYIVITGHYDTTGGPGTNDNGSGTTLMLEMARLLVDVDTEYSIKFIHFSGEEQGLIGSQYFVNNMGSLNIREVFNLDQVGGYNHASAANDTIVCERDEDNSPSSNNAASYTLTNILSNCIQLYSTLNTEISYAYSSDYVPFENVGEIITGLYEKDETPYSHGPNDTLANMVPSYLVQVTKGALGFLLERAISVAKPTLTTPNYVTENTFNLYPNPSSNGIVNLHFKQNTAANTSITIYNVLGTEVFKKLDLQLEEQLNLKHLNSGIYLASITIGNKKITKKIILN